MASASGLNRACTRLSGASGTLGGLRAAAAPVGCGRSSSCSKSWVSGLSESAFASGPLWASACAANDSPLRQATDGAHHVVDFSQ